MNDTLKNKLIPGSETENLSEEVIRLIVDRSEAYIRQIRDSKLSTDVDPIVSNPLRWASIPQDKQQEILDYRQALLDVTKQEKFPYDVTWPEKPKL